ncbi:hypothetical protein [Mesorhizobium sp.]|uniref:hypothetical protein n=1 Tax=Mesorhizobium sp. TaxID=1871066 RepID=UPI0011F820AE|nr:hypothetical protein [Mesorhizobium sp.]TJV14897.1 MAG: hypothetical protein E5Y07_24545 [Mesorhizobium sp.]
MDEENPRDVALGDIETHCPRYLADFYPIVRTSVSDFEVAETLDEKLDCLFTLQLTIASVCVRLLPKTR